MLTPVAFFISDAHLGAEPAGKEAARVRRLHRFLASLPGRAASLYVVGDLFDFWYEYRTAIPRRYFHTLAALRRVREAGVDITCMTGNHDFWLGRFLAEEIGLRTLEGPLPVELQGRRIWLHHGDGLLGGDVGYKLLKRVVRSRLAIGLYGLLHPDLGLPLAHWFSNLSRHSRAESQLEGERMWREVALPRFAEGFDAVMIGHFHHAYERHEDGRDFFVLGDWIDQFTYVVLEEGRFRLESWPEG